MLGTWDWRWSQSLGHVNIVALSWVVGGVVVQACILYGRVVAQCTHRIHQATPTLPLHLFTPAPPACVGCIVNSRACVAVAVYNSSCGCVLCVVERCPPGQVGNRIIRKRINVRVEHVRQSKCRQDFLDRVKRNEDIKRQAKESGSTCACSTWQPALTHTCAVGEV